MIRTFLKDLPYTLTQPMYREYEDKCRALERWYQQDQRQRTRGYLAQRDTIHYIFALGIYYRYVIAPLSSSAKFFERLEMEFDAGLSVGGKIIRAEFRTSIQNSANQFSEVLKSFGLGVSFFAQTDVSHIVMWLIDLEERIANEQN